MAKSMSYKEKAYRYLKEQIDNNVLLAGTHLKENDLAKQLDMSRTPIRKALDQLAKEKYVRIEPYKGAVVCKNTLNSKAIVERLQFIELLVTALFKQMENKGITVNTKQLDEIAHHLKWDKTIDQINDYYDAEAKLFQLLVSYHSNAYFRRVTLDTVLNLHELYINEAKKREERFLAELEDMQNIYPPFIQVLKDGDYPQANKYIRMWINKLILQQINY
ncbi:GntR family transcriptional regulator [Aerococcus urinae]|uniref:GntR family transcriptional regulator n=1 Tax=Aerococcus urinae TaxID=1376 RepID=UPI0018A78E30|nr:GntR family transcriptional regulator [Aerococcus urinae]